MRIKAQRLAGFTFLILLVLFLSGSSCSGTVNKYTPPQVENVKISSLKIVVQVPSYMRVNQSYRIRASLVPKTGQVSSIFEGKSKMVSSPINSVVGTPNATLLNAFGPEYEPYATASLDASSFTVVPNYNDVKELALNQREVHWDWNVTPNFDNTQTIGVNVWIQWIRTKGGSLPPLSYSIGYAQVSLDIDNPNDTNRHWMSVQSLVNSMFTPVLSTFVISFITWLVSWLVLRQKPKKEKETEDKSKPPAGTDSSTPPASQKKETENKPPDNVQRRNQNRSRKQEKQERQ